MSLCPYCRQEIEAFQREQTAGAAADYSRTFEVLPTLLQDRVVRMEEEQRQARRRRSKRSVKPGARFPVFKVPANARLIPTSRIQKALKKNGII
jgi:uncharacterized protein YbaR (Trm112 family)